MSNKKVLVTGGLGFIGFHLAMALAKSGEYDVDVVDWDECQLERQALLWNEGVMVEICNFTDAAVLSDVAAGHYDTVFHLAAIPRVSYSVEFPQETHENNVNSTVELLEAVRQAKKTRFVFSSSSSVYGGADTLPTPETEPKDPKSPYALQKSVIEDYCRVYSKNYGISTICLRYFNVFGPGAKGDGGYATAISAWIHCVKNRLPLRSDGNGSQSRDLCPVENVVHANILAAKYEGVLAGDCFNVACGDRTTNREILNYFTQRFPGIQINHVGWRAGDVMHTHADISKSKEILGYEPVIKFWEALENTIKVEFGL